VITGKVLVDDRPLDQPRVVIVPWPVRGNLYASVIETNGNSDGEFRIPNLPSGDYRIIAVDTWDAESLQEPYVLERALSRGLDVNLGPNAFKSLTLRPIDPRR
jgi:hypothetical protein